MAEVGVEVEPFIIMTRPVSFRRVSPLIVTA
jgi:hypothetical protein